MIGPSVTIVHQKGRIRLENMTWSEALCLVDAWHEHDARKQFAASPWVFAAVETALLMLIR